MTPTSATVLLWSTMSRRPSAAARITLALAAATLPTAGCGTCDDESSVKFTREESGTAATLRDAVSLADGGVVAVGDGGAIVTRDANGHWSLRTAGTTNDLYAVASRTAFMARWTPQTASLLAPLIPNLPLPIPEPHLSPCTRKHSG